MQPVGFPYNFSLREHLRRAVAEAAPEWALPGGEAADWPAWRAGLEAALGRLLSATCEASDLPEARLLDQEAGPGFTRARVALAVAVDLSVPAYLLTPDPPPETGPAVLCLARHPAGKAGLAGELGPGLGTVLCSAGLRVLIPDLPGGGERSGDGPGVAATLLARGDSLLAWEVREARLWLAYLGALADTAPGQVGLVGVGGGLWPALLAGCLAPEVKAIALHGDLQGLAARLVVSNCLQEAGSEEPAPGLLALADLPELLALLAPRPLLLAPEAEARGAERTLRLAAEAYERQGHGPRCEVQAEATGAEAFAAAAAEFLNVWLPAAVEI
jgi:dienelactone hydrolase